MLGLGLSLPALAVRRLSGEAAFSPASLFAAGEQGLWYDPSDLSTMFQDTAGTTPVTAAGQAVARIEDKSGRGNHATQDVTARRPILRQTAGGVWYLEFDGVDDRLLTANIPFSGGQVTSFASIRQTGGISWAHVWRSSDTGSGYWAVGQQGSTSPPNQAFGVGSPVYRLNAQALNPFTRAEIYNRAFNADTITTTTSLVLAPDQLLISGYTTAFLNGRLYSLIVRGAATPLADIQQTEAWIAAKSGVVLP